MANNNSTFYGGNAMKRAYSALIVLIAAATMMWIPGLYN